ncbi:ATP-binding protein [Flavobacterium sp. NRK F10]|uniref:sensor histidine kinase n=1 Tax=Flavobacterium sp. NRK F10 TaxID=2954931 RepID=UPI002090034D|nr:ATP-binding protein [Flavobacterium sp. NRK F10]MCO6175025.1 ATP-binding protein [Flavobacterium sp. NRK F10]
MIKRFDIFIRLLLILLCLAGSFFLFQKEYHYTALLFLIIALGLFLELLSFISSIFEFYDKTILSILNKDFSADFKSKKYQGFYTNLFVLYEQLKSSQKEQITKDTIYHSIFNTIETGVLILEKKESDWQVTLMNDYFSHHFKAPKVSKWSYLNQYLPALCEIIEEHHFSDFKTPLQIRVDKQDYQTFILQTAQSKIYNKEYYIVLLDSIQKVIEKKEKEAWINLMKVISHELMNSLTPIHALAQNLQETTLQDTLSQEDISDIKESVGTISNRTRHLQQFVENYRKLAALPSPKKEKIALQELLKNSLQIMQPLLKKEQIAVSNEIGFDRWISVDRQQLEQVLINLLTNSIYALADKTNKQITLSGEVKEKRLFIYITDTGKGIEKEIEDKIFLPFFTTRKEGAGIGLTLSKNIIEAHGGYLTFESNENETKFTICLLE